MNRRSFFRKTTGAAIGLAVAPFASAAIPATPSTVFQAKKLAVLVRVPRELLVFEGGLLTHTLAIAPGTNLIYNGMELKA